MAPVLPQVFDIQWGLEDRDQSPLALQTSTGCLCLQRTSLSCRMNAKGDWLGQIQCFWKQALLLCEQNLASPGSSAYA